MLATQEIRHELALLNHIHIYDETISCKVFPNLGGSIQELTWKGISIIDGINSNQEGIDRYYSAYQSAILFPFPNRIENGQYTYQNQTFQLNINDQEYGHALHGLVYDKTFLINDIITKNDAVEIKLTYTSDGTLKGFPFQFQLDVNYSIAPSGSLTISCKVENIGNKSFPFGIGWHPYFKADKLYMYSLESNTSDVFFTNEHKIPLEATNSDLETTILIDQLNFDHSYQLQKPIVHFTTQYYKFSLAMEHTETSFLQLYTPEDRKSIALEPMTCIGNSFNHGIGLLELLPNETYNWSANLKFEAHV